MVSWKQLYYSRFNDYSQDKNLTVQSLKGGVAVISYEPFWRTLRASQETTYTLITRHHISSSTIDKLRKNKPLSTTTINDLCRILQCPIDQVMEYLPSEKDQIL